jgi:thioredoxin 1
MKTQGPVALVGWLAVLVTGFLAPCLLAAGKPAAPAASEKAPLVSATYPGLASGCLTYARLSDLPKGTLLKAGDLVLAEKDVADEIAKAPQDIQAQLKKNGFFMLEQIAGPKLIVQVAKADAARTGKELPSQVDRLIIDYHLGSLAEKVDVTDAEVADFYAKNKDMVGDATLDQVKAEIRNYLVREKQQAAIAKYIETLGQRTPIEVSAAWVKEQAALAKDNLVDKARASGRPSMVDFGASGCRPCDMMAPILETLKKKHEGKANVLFVQVREEQVLAARYGVQSIPVQVFFDKDGKEVFRHVGFFPQDEIEKKLAEMGVK